jgi:hypothetical protein
MVYWDKNGEILTFLLRSSSNKPYEQAKKATIAKFELIHLSSLEKQIVSCVLIILRYVFSERKKKN